MSKHLIAWIESANPSSYTKLKPAADQTMTQDLTGKTYTVPALNYICASYAWGITTNPGLTRYQFSSPSLRANTPIQIDQVDTTASNPGDLPNANSAFQSFDDNPIDLKIGELLEADIVTAGGTAGYSVVLAWLDDLNPAIVVNDGTNLFPGVRCTSSTTLTAYAWTACTMTFDNTLPVGTYALVGMQAISATGVAARAIISGYPWRMGVIPCKDTVAYKRPEIFRNGRWGKKAIGQFVSWGAFISTSPPQMEFLALAADTSETVLMDLVKIA